MTWHVMRDNWLTLASTTVCPPWASLASTNRSSVGTDRQLVSAIELVDGGNGTNTFVQIGIVHNCQDLCLSHIHESVRCTEHAHIVYINAHVRVQYDWNWWHGGSSLKQLCRTTTALPQPIVSVPRLVCEG